MPEKGNLEEYAECKHIKRTKPDARVTEEIAKEIGSNYRTLPAFEQSLFDHVAIKHYSLQRNELFRCRWEEYKLHIEQRVFAPFRFPDVRDLHFYNGSIRFLPSESIHQFPEHRMKLKPGPGVDVQGQVPIPHELQMKRGKVEKQDGRVRKAINKKNRDTKKN